MTWQLALKTILGIAQSLLASDDPPAAVIGSVATALQGCAVRPRDLDLLAVRPGVVSAFAGLMAAHTPTRCEHPVGHAKWLSSAELPVSVGPDEYGFQWHFGRWEVEGVKVEIAHIAPPEGFPTSKDGGGIWEAGPEIWSHLRRVPFAGHQVPVVPLEIQLETAMGRELEERASAILEVLRRDGFDHALLQVALSEKHVRTFEAEIAGTQA